MNGERRSYKDYDSVVIKSTFTVETEIKFDSMHNDTDKDQLLRVGFSSNTEYEDTSLIEVLFEFDSISAGDGMSWNPIGTVAPLYGEDAEYEIWKFVFKKISSLQWRCKLYRNESYCGGVYIDTAAVFSSISRIYIHSQQGSIDTPLEYHIRYIKIYNE